MLSSEMGRSESAEAVKAQEGPLAPLCAGWYDALSLHSEGIHTIFTYNFIPVFLPRLLLFILS